MRFHRRAGKTKDLQVPRTGVVVVVVVVVVPRKYLLRGGKQLSVESQLGSFPFRDFILRSSPVLGSKKEQSLRAILVFLPLFSLDPVQ